MIIKRLPLLIAGGIGYVLGTKAGRERYDQLMSAYDKVRNDPRVQEKAQQATDLAREKAPIVKDKLTDVAGSATDKVKASTGGGSGPDTDKLDQLNPDSTALHGNPGPQGTLP